MSVWVGPYVLSTAWLGSRIFKEVWWVNRRALARDRETYGCVGEWRLRIYPTRSVF